MKPEKQFAQRAEQSLFAGIDRTDGDRVSVEVIHPVPIMLVHSTGVAEHCQSASR
jgi:hypothetical protein